MSDNFVLSFFDLADADKDGVVTKDELKKVFKDKRFDDKFIEVFEI